MRPPLGRDGRGPCRLHVPDGWVDGGGKTIFPDSFAVVGYVLVFCRESRAAPRVSTTNTNAVGANLFMAHAPLEGRRHVAVRSRHTAADYAHVQPNLADFHFPGATKIILVQDNLNTHRPASFYDAFTPAEARRIADRFEWQCTPKHSSWLNARQRPGPTLP